MMQRLMFFSLFLLLIGSTTVEAKWWIFGQSHDEVATRYVSLNNISYDELGDQVTLYRDMLPAGQVEIRGRGQSGRNRIGAAEISLDGGQSWQKIDLSRDGSFYFRFTPEINREYDLALRLLDTSGKSNEVDDTRKKLTVSDRDIQSIIREALDAMINAYQFKNARDFMSYVDPDFAGDAMILERAIQKDFTILDQIMMRYTLNSLVSGSGGKVFTAISFNRQVTVARNGDVLKDKGETEFTFALMGDKAKISAMKNPLIFGLSERESVAQGDVNQPNDEGNLHIPDDGGLPYVGSPDGEAIAGNSSIPTPTIVQSFFDGCQVDIQYAANMSLSAQQNYNIVLENSLNAVSWQDAAIDSLDGNDWIGADSGSFSTLTTAYVKQSPQTGSFIYYRLRAEHKTTKERSFPSPHIFGTCN